MLRSLSRAALVALTVFAGSSAGAQVTTVIPPPRQSDQVRVDSVRRAEAAQDSVARVTMTGMKEWVDSAAAALAVQPDTTRSPAADSALAGVTPRPPAAQAPPPAREPRDAPAEFREGAAAPDTATSAPALALAGGVLLVAGGLLLLRGRQAARMRRHGGR